MKWIGDLDMKKKIRYHLNSYGRLKLMTCSDTHRERIFYRKKMTGCHIERGFLLRAKE